MLKLILVITLRFQKETVSLQRQILNRLAKKRALLDYSSHELLEFYEHANRFIKDRRTKTRGFSSGIRFLLDHPRTALNLVNGEKVPIAEFEKFRNMLNQSETTK